MVIVVLTILGYIPDAYHQALQLFRCLQRNAPRKILPVQSQRPKPDAKTTAKVRLRVASRKTRMTVLQTEAVTARK